LTNASSMISPSLHAARFKIRADIQRRDRLIDLLVGFGRSFEASERDVRPLRRRLVGKEFGRALEHREKPLADPARG
jgi:hypothetical protein